MTHLIRLTTRSTAVVNRNSNIVRRPVYALVYVTGLAAVLSPVIAFVTSR